MFPVMVWGLLRGKMLPLSRRMTYEIFATSENISSRIRTIHEGEESPCSPEPTTECMPPAPHHEPTDLEGEQRHLHEPSHLSDSAPKPPIFEGERDQPSVTAAPCSSPAVHLMCQPMPQPTRCHSNVPDTFPGTVYQLIRMLVSWQ